MNITTIQDALYDFVDGVTTWPVIWAEQNAPAPDDPYLTLRLDSFSKIDQDDQTHANISGVVTVTGNREFILKVQAYGVGAIGQLTVLDSALELFTKLESLRKSSIVYVRSEGVTDLTDLVETRYRGRASLDIVFRIAENQTDTIGLIEKAEGEATYERPVGADIVVPISVDTSGT